MRIEAGRTAALIIDLQERLLPHMHGKDDLINRCTVLLKGLKILDIPMFYTEQYPAGLGRTMAEIGCILNTAPMSEKTAFSCCDEPSVMAQLQQLGKATILLAGIESHVCVLQTALDLKAAEFDPVIVADAVASRREYDRAVALQRLANEGCRITTAESVLFELMRTSRHSAFREISRLVR